MKDADGVGAAAHAGDHRVRQPAGGLEHLLAGLQADHPLEVPDHHRERVRAADRADAVVRVADRPHPVAEGLVHGVLERAGTGRDRDDLGAQHPHAGHVQRLPAGVLLAHVDGAVQVEQRARGRGGHAVLAGPGLRDHPGLAHPPGQQHLAEHVVDLVRPGVGQILALEQHRAAASLLAEPPGLGEQRRPARVAAQQPVKLGPEDRIPARLLVGGGQFVQRRHQRLGGEPSAVGDARGLAGPALLGDPDRADHEVTGDVGHRGDVGLGGLCLLAELCLLADLSVLGGGRHPRSPRSAGCEPAVTRSATAQRGSFSVTRLSPTSTASAPDAA